MRLHARQEGAGERTALLLHGLMGSAESWVRVSALLASQGFRVIALDLPGHGLSERDPHCSIRSMADAVIETLNILAPHQDVHAIGHSLGGTVLAAAAERTRFARTVFVDTACAFDGGADQEALAAHYERDRQLRRDPAGLRAARPYYSSRDIQVEARAAERFDPHTAAALSSGQDVRVDLPEGAILVRAVPSRWVTEQDARTLQESGVEVRSIADAEHTIWYSHFEEFAAALPEFFGARQVKPTPSDELPARG